LKNFKPAPDFEEFKKLILGTIEPTRLPVTDLYINDEILQQFVEEILDRTWVPRDENLDKYYQNYVLCYKQMGFDYVPLHFWIETTFTNFPKPERWISTGSMGLVRNEHEFESFPWNDIGIDDRHLGSIEKFLPEGMKIMAVGGDFQELLDVIVGTENFFFMMYDQPELLERIIQMWFGIRLKMNSELISRDSVGGFFNCADLGSKSATLIAPDYIRKHFLPTWASYGRKAHDADKMYWFHSCGNIYKDHVIDDLINVAKIDAFHSFQDTIMPVQDFKRVYGEQTATLGGIDIDMITRLEGDDLRKHVRSVFHECAPGGRYGAGTGNSVAAYVPLKNWLLLLEEALAYRY
jgi:uroporphyrinogen decarboxylase